MKLEIETDSDAKIVAVLDMRPVGDDPFTFKPARLCCELEIHDDGEVWKVSIRNHTDLRALADFLSSAAGRMQVVYERRMRK